MLCDAILWRMLYQSPLDESDSLRLYERLGLSLITKSSDRCGNEDRRWMMELIQIAEEFSDVEGCKVCLQPEPLV